jgi:hypothetical protein
MAEKRVQRRLAGITYSPYKEHMLEGHRKAGLPE